MDIMNMYSIPCLELKDRNIIPKMGVGTYNLKDRECRQSVKIALREGYTHIDTAEFYKNESAIGDAISDADRSNLFITSKVWPTNLRHENVLNSCRDSLKRLDTSYLDLYLIHWPNNSIPIEETIEALEKLNDEGKIRSVGVSNFTKSELKEAMKTSNVPIVANQVEFHPWLYQKELLDFCLENDIALIAYAPIARTKVFQESAIRELSEKYGKTPAQITLRWEIEKGALPIPKSASEKHIRENIQIFDWKLKPGDVEKIDSISKEKRLVNSSYSSF